MGFVRYTAALSYLVFATSAIGQEAGTPAKLTEQDRQMLRVVYAYVQSECARDPSATYCSSLLPEKPAVAAPLASTYVAAGNVPADASRHLPKDAGLSIPEKNSADFGFAATSDTKTASATLSVDLSPVTHSLNTLAVTVETPFGQGSDYQNLATLDGLTKATTAGIQFTYIPSARYVPHSLVFNSDEYQLKCREVLNQAESIDPKIAEDPRVKLTGRWCDDGPLEQTINDSKKITASQKTLLTDKLHELHLTTTPVLESMWMFALNGKFGYEKHDYFSDTALAKSSVDRYPWQLGAAATYVFEHGLMSLTLGYNFQKSYEDGRSDGDKEVVCPPSSGANVTCVDGYIGPPQRQVKHLFSADWRFIAPTSLFSIPIGIDPGVTYDAKSHEYAFQFPIYIATNSSKGLTGGVRYDYTSKKKESIFGVFVSAAFCVLPGFSGCAPSDTKSDK